MIRYAIWRLLATIPTLIGINLVTFVVLNLSMKSPDPLDAELSGAASGRVRLLGLHLPLFINLSIDDARARAQSEIAKLGSDRAFREAERTIAKAGGAWLPYILPRLPNISSHQRERALNALDLVARRIGLNQALSVSLDRAAFWERFWQTHGSDFKPVRAARLVRRLIKREDRLAETELRQLDTFSLPQLMAALDEEIPIASKVRIITLIEDITGLYDPIIPTASQEEQAATLERWRFWWWERKDRYTVFEGYRNITGAFTETRYFKWLERMVTLDFGVSVRDGRPILTKLAERLPVTVTLSLLALLFAYGLAIPLGVVSAVRRGGLFDRATTVALFILYAFPAFWMAALLMRYFAGTGYYDALPAEGLVRSSADLWVWWRRLPDLFWQLFLPVFCLSFVPMAMLTRYQRVGMLQVINLDFMRTARAKGLSRTNVILRHGLRNGVIPVVTMAGLQIPYIVSGSVVIERIFGIPGMGYETFEALKAHDQPWLMAVVTVTAIVTLFGVVAADVVYALIDPRIAPGFRQGGRP
ncbi:MAG: ABC transporter permease [Myxococcota bacterium]|nr:ABC transporter permease [Myxococcota bacterium]